MSARPGFTITKIKPVHGGNSPNAFVPRVTVEVRVHYPTHQIHVAQDVLREACDDAVRELMRRADEYDTAMGGETWTPSP